MPEDMFYCLNCGHAFEDDFDAINKKIQMQTGVWCNKYVSLLLCVFLGCIGAHRFYEKKIGTGILYLFTFGLFGIGWFVDIIRIALQPNPYRVK